MTKTVRKVTMKSMAGSSKLHKSINAFLTRRFVLTAGVPSDECLDEAEAILAMISVYLNTGIVFEIDGFEIHRLPGEIHDKQ